MDIVVMGSNTVDVYVTASADMISLQYPSGDDHSDEDLVGFPLGQKVLAEGLDLDVGGSGLNAATAFARSGLETTYLGCTGDDAFGSMVRDHLNSEDIAVKGSVTGKNGVGVVIETQATDRTILSYKGSNNDLCETSVPDVSPSWFYTSTVMGETKRTMASLITSFDETTTAVNISPYLAKDGLEEIEDVLNATDYLFLNFEEAKQLTGATEIPEVFDRLQDVLRGIPLVTHGENGVYYEDGDIYHMPPQADTVEDTTGAGDAFNAGFIVARASGRSREDAVRAGMIQAESVVKTQGTTEGLLSRDNVLAALNEDEREPTVIR